MDDSNGFERIVADEMQRRGGPAPIVDDAAIFASITAARSRRWSFGSMFSATKLVVTGAILALVGGFLLAGLLTTQQDHEMVPAAMTESPPPMSSEELLSAMVSEEVEPGVYKVLNDGVRDLGPGLADLAVTPDGRVWLLRYDQTSGQDTERSGDDRWRARVIGLGEPGVSYERKHIPAAGYFRLDTDRLGSLVLRFGNAPETGQTTYGADGWIELPVAPFEECVRGYGDGDYPGIGVAADGACWTVTQENSPVSVSVDGEHRLYDLTTEGIGWATVVDLELDGHLAGVLVDEDGLVWTANTGAEQGGGWFGGFVRFDGQAWSHIPYDLGDDPLEDGPWYLSHILTDPGGTTWAVFYGLDPSQVWMAGWDGARWRTARAAGGVEDWQADTLPDGRYLVSRELVFDGRTLGPWVPLPSGREIRVLELTPDGAAWALVDEGGDIEPDALYLITPAAMATTR